MGLKSPHSGDKNPLGLPAPADLSDRQEWNQLTRDCLAYAGVTTHGPTMDPPTFTDTPGGQTNCQLSNLITGSYQQLCYVVTVANSSNTGKKKGRKRKKERKKKMRTGKSPGGATWGEGEELTEEDWHQLWLSQCCLLSGMPLAPKSSSALNEHFLSFGKPSAQGTKACSYAQDGR